MGPGSERGQRELSALGANASPYTDADEVPYQMPRTRRATAQSASGPGP